MAGAFTTGTAGFSEGWASDGWAGGAGGAVGASGEVGGEVGGFASSDLFTAKPAEFSDPSGVDLSGVGPGSWVLSVIGCSFQALPALRPNLNIRYVLPERIQ